MTNAFEPDLNNFMGRGSTGVPADGDVWAWDEETGRSKPVAAAGGGGDILSSETQLTNAEFLDLLAHPYELVAGVANKSILPLSIYWYVDTGAGAYTKPGAGDQDLWIITEGTDFNSVYFAHSQLRGLVTNVQAQGTFEANVQGNPPGSGQIQFVAGAALVLANTGADDYGGGDPANTISCHVEYLLVPVAPFGA